MSEREEEAYGQQEQSSRTAHHRLLMAEHPQQSYLVILTQPHCEECLFRQSVTALAAAKQIAAQYRSKRKSDNGGCKQRHDERYTKRYEHLALHTTKEEQRHKAYDYYNGGIEDRHTHLARSIEHHVEHWLALLTRQHAVLAQMLPHILHIHYGIVHKRADGNGHTSETHGVDAQSHVMEYEQRYEQRQRQSDKRYDRRTHIGKEQEQHNHNKDSTLDERLLHVVDRTVDEVCLSEYVGRYMHIRRHVLLKVLHGLLKFLGQLYRSGVRLFRHGEQHSRLTFYRSHSQLGLLSSYPYISHIGQCHRGAR